MGSEPLNILDEANRVTAGERFEDYGHPYENAQAWARMASAATGLDLQPHHLPIVMICLKLARIRGGTYHRDTLVDIAGYARVHEMIYEKAGDILETINDVNKVLDIERKLP